MFMQSRFVAGVLSAIRVVSRVDRTQILVGASSAGAGVAAYLIDRGLDLGPVDLAGDPSHPVVRVVGRVLDQLLLDGRVVLAGELAELLAGGRQLVACRDH